MSASVAPEALADLATAVWRLQNKAVDEPVARHVRTVVEQLSHVGIETRRYDDEPFDSGLSLRVLAIQPTNGLERETIVETVRPAVYLHDQLIQNGEVIVGIPKTSDVEEADA